MKILPLLLIGVSIMTSACTTTCPGDYTFLPPPPHRVLSQGFRYVDQYPSNERHYHQRRCREERIVVGPQYYKTEIPYSRHNMKNYTGTPIIAPNASGNSFTVVAPTW